ncbi:MAG: polysaccharide deacetylase family protein [Deltaproteobacteria bacterium]|nr:polysaccharide deacetylase family protein [Deltaproteobacteria bacterium]
MSEKKLCAVSVDLDSLTAYYEIHGLGGAPTQLKATVLRKALPRFEELFAEAGIPATLFVVGRELEDELDAQQTLRRMAEAGHELANHTYTHPYDLCRLPEQVVEQEVRKTHELLRELAGEGHAPVGFRSPGYFINGKVLGVLANHGYLYDSSMFPSPPYYAAKAAVLAMMALRGRRSGAVLSDPRGLTGPTEPYRPDVEHPWRRGHAPLVELPVAVIPGLRVPAIGTMLAVAPEWVRSAVLAQMARVSFFNLELHGIDLADAVADRIPTALAGRQPDLRVPFAEKRAIFLRTLEGLKDRYRFVTLREAAELVQREGKI